MNCFPILQMFCRQGNSSSLKIKRRTHIHELKNLGKKYGELVLTEKPMAISLEDADRMIAAEKETGKCLGVIFQSRYEAGVLSLYSALNDLYYANFGVGNDALPDAPSYT